MAHPLRLRGGRRAPARDRRPSPGEHLRHAAERALRREAEATTATRHRFFVFPPGGGATLVLRNITLSGGRSPNAAFAVTNENSFFWNKAMFR